MNVRGIGNNNKRRETFNWLRNKQQSIIFLQEVHCTEATIDTWRSEWGYKALFRACLHGGGGPRVGEVTRLGGVTRLSI